MREAFDQARRLWREWQRARQSDPHVITWMIQAGWSVDAPLFWGERCRCGVAGEIPHFCSAFDHAWLDGR